MPRGIDIIAYADDLVIISRGTHPAKKLQVALDAMATTANSLGLFFSPAKTKVMVFHTHNIHRPNFHLEQQPIEMVSHCKYLGVVLDRRLSFNKHAEDLKIQPD